MVRFRVALLATIALGSTLPASASAPAPHLDLIATFDTSVPASLTRLPGLEVRYEFRNAPSVLVSATPEAARDLMDLPELSLLELDAPIEPTLDTATVVTRARGVWEGASKIEVDGEKIDGTGVGIAIVDTGIDGLHPDLVSRMAGNWQVTFAGPVPAPNSTSPISSHGTHVAGIAAGTGAASQGRFTGVAPDASLYGFSVFQGTVSTAAIAFDWILTNGASQDPPIRIVNNSWRCTPNACNHVFNPEGDGERLHTRLARQMATDGIAITWAVANEKGDGDIATTTPESTLQTPGIIGVANYKDGDTTSRNMCLSSSSSWGSSSDPTTWPDVAAPGRSIMSTWATAPSDGAGNPGGRNPVTGERTYNEQSGTSMAAPHVAGVAALMLEAEPSLTPAEIEYILKQTATPLTGTDAPLDDQTGCGIDYVRADPSHPWTPANYAAGHGLIDARAAVEMAIDFPGIPSEAPDLEPLTDDFVVSRPGIGADQTLYLSGEDAFTTEYPDSSAPRVRMLGPSDRVIHTTAPLDETTFEALQVDVFLGSTAEGGDFFSIIGRTDFVATVDRVAPNGGSTLIHEFSSRNIPVRTLAPIHRDYRIMFEEPVTIQQGERIRLTLSVIVFPWLGVQPAVNEHWNVYSEGHTPSRIALGSIVERPDPQTRAGCERRKDCAMVDELHPYEGLSCAAGIGFRLTWSGPVGSSLIFNCDGAVTTCTVVGTPGETGTCETDAPTASTTDDHGSFCTYVLPDGGRGGKGRCMAINPIPNA